MSDALKAPLVWFGGKRKVAPLVWAALGDVVNYAEPFAGSLAVLLARPPGRWIESGAETVNDADCFLSNFWRALKADPVAVAEAADWPVNECDLLARHAWLVSTGRERIARMEADPEYYDAKVAGYWVWGLNSWIGAGWCSGNGPWQIVDGRLVHRSEAGEGNPGQGVNRKLPHLGTRGQGVNRKLPHLGDRGRGVNRKRPHLGTRGQGVNRKLPHLGDRGRGVNRQLPHLGDRGRDKPGREESLETLIAYFEALAARLRRVRVCCGDWSRIVTRGALSYGDTVGVFLDPPYLGDVRTADLYSCDDHSIANKVREWAIATGDDRRMRIVLAGYEAEHAGKMPSTWRMVEWKANAAYQGHDSGDDANKANRKKERLWLSPHCLHAGRLL